MADPKMVECKKCGAKWSVEMMQRKNTVMCALCLEPIPELIELDRCDWSEGDLGKE